jgi:hypothetical protein
MYSFGVCIYLLLLLSNARHHVALVDTHRSDDSARSPFGTSGSAPCSDAVLRKSVEKVREHALYAVHAHARSIRPLADTIRAHMQRVILGTRPRARIIYLALDSRGCRVALASLVSVARHEYGLGNNILAFARGGRLKEAQPSATSDLDLGGLDLFWSDVLPTLTPYDLIIAVVIDDGREQLVDSLAGQSTIAPLQTLDVFLSQSASLPPSAVKDEWIAKMQQARHELLTGGVGKNRATELDGRPSDSIESSNQILLLLRAAKKTGARMELLRVLQSAQSEPSYGVLGAQKPQPMQGQCHFVDHPQFLGLYSRMYSITLHQMSLFFAPVNSQSLSLNNFPKKNQPLDRHCAELIVTRLLALAHAYATPHAFVLESVVPLAKSIRNADSFTQALAFTDGRLRALHAHHPAAALRSRSAAELRDILARAILRLDSLLPSDAFAAQRLPSKSPTVQWTDGVSVGSCSEAMSQWSLLPSVLQQLAREASEENDRRRVNPMAVAMVMASTSDSISVAQAIHLLLRCRLSVSRALTAYRQLGGVWPSELLRDDGILPPLADIAKERVSSDRFPRYPPLPATPPLHQSTLALVLRFLATCDFTRACRVCHAWLAVGELPMAKPKDLDRLLESPSSAVTLARLVHNRLYRGLRSMHLSFVQDDWTNTVAQLPFFGALEQLVIIQMGDCQPAVFVTAFQQIAAIGKLTTLTLGFELAHPGLTTNVSAIHAAMAQLTCLRHLFYASAFVTPMPATHRYQQPPHPPDDRPADALSFLLDMPQLETLALPPIVCHSPALLRLLSRHAGLKRLIIGAMDDIEIDRLLGDGSVAARLQADEAQALATLQLERQRQQQFGLNGRTVAAAYPKGAESSSSVAEPSPPRPSHRMSLLEEIQLEIGAKGTRKTTGTVSLNLVASLPALRSLRLIFDFYGQPLVTQHSNSPFGGYDQHHLHANTIGLTVAELSLASLASMQSLRHLSLVVPEYRLSPRPTKYAEQRNRYQLSTLSLLMPSMPVRSAVDLCQWLVDARVSTLTSLRVDSVQGWHMSSDLTRQLAGSGLAATLHHLELRGATLDSFDQLSVFPHLRSMHLDECQSAEDVREAKHSQSAVAAMSLVGPNVGPNVAVQGYHKNALHTSTIQLQACRARLATLGAVQVNQLTSHKARRKHQQQLAIWTSLQEDFEEFERVLHACEEQKKQIDQIVASTQERAQPNNGYGYAFTPTFPSSSALSVPSPSRLLSTLGSLASFHKLVAFDLLDLARFDVEVCLRVLLDARTPTMRSLRALQLTSPWLQLTDPNVEPALHQVQAKRGTLFNYMAGYTAEQKAQIQEQWSVHDEKAFQDQQILYEKSVVMHERLRQLAFHLASRSHVVILGGSENERQPAFMLRYGARDAAHFNLLIDDSCRHATLDCGGNVSLRAAHLVYYNQIAMQSSGAELDGIYANCIADVACATIAQSRRHLHTDGNRASDMTAGRWSWSAFRRAIECPIEVSPVLQPVPHAHLYANDEPPLPTPKTRAQQPWEEPREYLDQKAGDQDENDGEVRDC